MSVGSRQPLGRYLGIGQRGGLAIAGACLATAFTAVAASVSYPTMIFSGPLAPYLGVGIGAALISAVVFCLATSLFSAYPGAVGWAQTEPAVILAVIASAIATGMVRDGGTAILPTVLVATAGATAACGVALLLIGQFRLANLVRYIPFPVMAGFLGAIGWLILLSALRVMTGFSVTHETALRLLDGDLLLRWVPGAVIGAGLWLWQTHRPHAAKMPAAIAGTVAGFWIVALLAGNDGATLAADGWLLEPFGDRDTAPLGAALAALPEADWQQFPKLVIEYGTLVLMTSISLLLITSGIEISTRTDLDLNRELRVIGVANLVGAVAGALPGYHSLNGSVMTYRLGAPVRLVGLAGAGAALLVLLVGTEVLALVPRLAVGALLTFLALSFLVDWLVRTWPRMEAADYGVLWAVFLAAAVFGVTHAIALGFAAGMVLFVVRYSRINVARNVMTGASYRSNVERADPAYRVLSTWGDEVYIVRLQGFLFFGTANVLLQLIRKRLGDTSLPPLRHLVFDMRIVSGADASAIESLARLLHYAAESNFTIELAATAPPLRSLLSRESIDERSAQVRLFPDLDRAVEYAEEDILARHMPKELERALSFDAQFASLPSAERALLRHYFESVTFAGGEVLIRQGSESHDMFFIEEGHVVVTMDLADGGSIRLKASGAGTAVGEIAFYLGGKRSASVIATARTRALRLSAERLGQMRVEAPAVAAALHDHMARLLALKMLETNRLVEALNG